MISIIESAEIEFDNITDPEVTPLSQNQKVCSATAVIKNLGNSEGITQNIQYQSKTMYRETGESSQEAGTLWGNLPAEIVNTASSYLRTQLNSKDKIIKLITKKIILILAHKQPVKILMKHNLILKLRKMTNQIMFIKKFTRRK